MPKRTDIKSILLIGAGPIVIGQACEFDYAGTQACKALKEEGYRLILVNSNPATIMTDPELADATYIEPITVESLTRIIAIERPQAILPTVGGQTALNVTLDLAAAGVLKQYQVEIIGASLKAIEVAENRALFQGLMHEIGLDVPRAIKIHNLKEAEEVLKKLNLPLVVRPSFTLGGSGAGIAQTKEEYLDLCEKAFTASPLQEVMIDEGLVGWKEFELEVIRDKKDNCIIVCGVENIDPLGVHTGDSITVAPIQTLTDKEYQPMRQAAFAVLRAVGVETGGSNVQFAVHPTTGRMVVIEMNPRVSRSSALVSKASGYPIAKVAAKLAVGYTLDELKNDITGDQLPASFEPTLDYVVVKIPRFNFEKFNVTQQTRGPQMRSVGEVMAIGRTFADALQKAMRSLEIGQEGFTDLYAHLQKADLEEELFKVGPLQLWAIGEAFRRGYTVESMMQFTHMDRWFLTEINDLIAMEKELALFSKNMSSFNEAILLDYKRHGFADSRIAKGLCCPVEEVATLRHLWKIHPAYKRIDSCAGEFPTSTAYLYSSYEKNCEAAPTTREKMLIIGSGPNRIGQGIEFDYCCVQAALALQEAGYETIMVNCNPETVSTDYDVVDRLYCTPLTFEDVMEIIRLEQPRGVFVQYGGQTPLQLANQLAAAGVPLLGVDVNTIHATEDREVFQQLLEKIGLKQPKNRCIFDIQAGIKAAQEMTYPLIVRPSFVLGGRAMRVVHQEGQLHTALENAFALHEEHPVLLEQFLENAIEIDVDAISDGKQVLIPALLEHVEVAGIHSGDSACFTPPPHLSLAIQATIKHQIEKIALHLSIRGVFNVQFAVQNQTIYILEVNPRASRTLPFLCKATGLPLVRIATHCVLGKSLSEQGYLVAPLLPVYCVKEAVLPFNKFASAEAVLGPEMKSTGEAMGIGYTPEEAYAKAQIAAHNFLPQPGPAWLIAPENMLESLQTLASKLASLGFSIYLNQENADLLKNTKFKVQTIPTLADVPSNLVLVIALNDISQASAATLSAARYAVDHRICHATTLRAAEALIRAIQFNLNESYSATSLQTLYKRVNYRLKPKHLLTGEELSAEQIQDLVEQGMRLKQERLQKNTMTALQGKHLALLFDKPSLRTRFSFTVAMHELGGEVIESLDVSRKEEMPEDQARVLSGYCHAIMVRTHHDSLLERMSAVSAIPVINGLSNLHHPCQILADLMTLLERFGYLRGLTLCYIGDGNNILHSLLLLAPSVGVNIHYACPPTRGPDQEILARSLAKLNPTTGSIKAFESPLLAVEHAHAVYTDVWTSMGFEEHAAEHLFTGFQVTEAVMRKAHPEAVFMHCLPMERGKEVNETLPEQPYSVIWQQSENRLHIQKAILLCLMQA